MCVNKKTSKNRQNRFLHRESKKAGNWTHAKTKLKKVEKNRKNLKKRRSPLGMCHELRDEKKRKNGLTRVGERPSFHVCEQKNVEKSPKSIPCKGNSKSRTLAPRKDKSEKSEKKIEKTRKNGLTRVGGSELRDEKTRKNGLTRVGEMPSFHVCEQKNVEKSPKSIP